MSKKSFSFNQNHALVIGVIIIIALGIYLLYIHQKSQKIQESFVQYKYYDNNINNNQYEHFKNNSSCIEKINFNKDTLYIYSTKKLNNGCKNLAEAAKSGFNPEYNISIAGIPKFEMALYHSNNGWSESIGLPSPKSYKGKFFDYIMSFLTNIKNIDYYTTDFSKSKTQPLTNKNYTFNSFFRKKRNIPDNVFIEIINDFFKVLVASNNNTSVRFISYYKKDNVTYNKNTDQMNFEEIDDEDLETEIKHNNVIVYFENINIIKFLQVTDPNKYKKYKKYQDHLSVEFI